MNLTFGTRYTDLCYGYNAFWSDCLPALNLDCGGFEVETVMNIRAAKADLRVQEIPSHEARRVHGESNLHVVNDGWRILKAIAAEARSPHWSRPDLRGPADRELSRVLPAPRSQVDMECSSAQITAQPSMISVVICAYTEQRWKETLAAVESVRATELSEPGDHRRRRPQPRPLRLLGSSLSRRHGGGEP